MPKMFNQLTEIIATITSLDTSEIQPDDELTEVVQGQVDTQLPRILASINQQFELDLDPTEIVRLAKDEKNPMTIEELISVIEEELEF